MKKELKFWVVNDVGIVVNTFATLKEAKRDAQVAMEQTNKRVKYNVVRVTRVFTAR
jgi:hypothetical protein